MFNHGLIHSKNPSSRDVANSIVRMYENAVLWAIESGSTIAPDSIAYMSRRRIEIAFDVVWEKDIEPILKVIGFDWMSEMNLIMRYWHP